MHAEYFSSTARDGTVFLACRDAPAPLAQAFRSTRQSGAAGVIFYVYELHQLGDGCRGGDRSG